MQGSHIARYMQRLHHRAVAGVSNTISIVRELSEDRPGSVVCRGADLVRVQVSPGWWESDPPRPHMVGAAQQDTACQGC